MSTADVRWLQRLDNYERALATLQRALSLAAERSLSELEEQGLIQAFEFTHELSWLLLKDFLVDQGVSGISGSRDAVREAVVRELISAGSEVTWMAMIRSRNLTSHTYNPSVAQDIAALIRERYAQELTALQRELRRRVKRCDHPRHPRCGKHQGAGTDPTPSPRAPSGAVRLQGSGPASTGIRSRPLTRCPGYGAGGTAGTGRGSR